MLTKKEFTLIIIAVIISAFIYALHKGTTYGTMISIALTPIDFILGLIIFFIIIFLNIFMKKFVSEYYSIKIEHRIWEFQQTGWSKKSKLKKPFPIGMVLPFTLSIISVGFIQCFTFFQFDAENIPRKRILRKRGLYRKEEINESDPAMTAAWGLYSLLFLAILAIIISLIIKPLDVLVFNIPLQYPIAELARYSIFYGMWNLIPISNLDGTKIFFGSLFNWFILTIFFILATIFAIAFI